MRLLPFSDSDHNLPKGSRQKKIGNRGERIARLYLKKRGWKILATNVRFGQDELDILALSSDRKTLSIVEVRTTSHINRNPEATVTQRKYRAMLRVANQMQSEATKHSSHLRVDLITVRLLEEKPQIRHYKGVLPLRTKKKGV